MNTLPRVEPGWLVLRAAADDRSRSVELATAAADLLPPGEQVVHDLGSGSGAMMRWLAPLLPVPQRWVLHDADAAILQHRDGQFPPHTTSVEALADLDRSRLADATIVVASALLDVITATEARRVVDLCVELRVPVLFSLTVTGRVEFDPSDDADHLFGTAFNEHQRRELDGRRLLGPDAVDSMAGMLAAARMNVHVVETPWQLGPEDRQLIAAWLEGWLDAAVEQQPGLRDLASDYRARRLAQLEAGALRVTVQHRDVLAWT